MSGDGIRSFTVHVFVCFIADSSYFSFRKRRHPNLIVVYGIDNPFDSPGSLTVVMELADKCLQKTALSKAKGMQVRVLI